jgi:hypothetical protein
MDEKCCRVTGDCEGCGPTGDPEACACGCVADDTFCDGAAKIKKAAE